MTDAHAEKWREMQDLHDLHDIPLVDKTIKVPADQSARFNAAMNENADEAAAMMRATAEGGPLETDLSGWLTFNVEVVSDAEENQA